jgi:hypothetical protein
MRARQINEALPVGLWDEGNLSAVKGWSDTSKNKIVKQIKTLKPLDIIIDDEIDLAKLKFVLNKYRIAYTEEKL